MAINARRAGDRIPVQKDVRAPHGSVRQTFGVAMLAPWTDLGATAYWVPGRAGPFNF